MKILNLWHLWIKMLNKTEDIPILLSRLVIAVIFIGTGLGKLRSLSHVTSYFASLGIPFPTIVTPFTAFTELLCGSLILVGLLTRIASIPLIVILLIAIFTAKIGDITSAYSLFEFVEFLYIVVLVWLVYQGGGRFSLDYFWQKRKLSQKI